MHPIALISMNVAPVGGVGADLLKAIRALCSQGREVHVIYGFLDPSTFDALKGCEVRWHRVFMPKRPPVLAQLTLLLCSMTILRKIRKQCPLLRVVCFERLPLGEAVVGCVPTSLWMAARRRMRLSPLSQIPYRLWRQCMDYLLQHQYQGKLIVHSLRDQKALLDRGVESEKIVRAIIPTDTKRFYPNSLAARRYISIIGANMRLKGIDLALDVWPRILQQYPDLCLRIITHGWKVKRAVEAAKLPSIEIADFKPQVEDYYHSSRLLLVPSMFETWGNVVVEALSCGVPVVASTDVPASEIITNHQMGFTFKRDGHQDVEFLYSAISSALELDMNTVAMAARHKRVSDVMKSQADLVQWVCSLP